MYCVIDIDMDYTHFMGIQLDSTYENVGEDMPVTGTIVSVPDSLPYDKAQWEKWRSHPYRTPFISKRMSWINENTMPWDTDIQVQPGDKVWFFYRGLENQRTQITHEVKYEHLYAKQTKDGLFMLNGYVGIEIQEESETFYGQKVATGQLKGIVAAVGTPLRSYKDYPHVDTDTLVIGDEVVYHNKFAFRMEANVHNRAGKDIHLVQRKEIFGYERA